MYRQPGKVDETIDSNSDKYLKDDVKVSKGFLFVTHVDGRQARVRISAINVFEDARNYNFEKKEGKTKYTLGFEPSGSTELWISGAHASPFRISIRGWRAEEVFELVLKYNHLMR